MKRYYIIERNEPKHGFYTHTIGTVAQYTKHIQEATRFKYYKDALDRMFRSRNTNESHNIVEIRT